MRAPTPEAALALIDNQIRVLVSLLLLLWPLWLTRRPEADSPVWARRSLILLITGLTFRYLTWRCRQPQSRVPIVNPSQPAAAHGGSWLLLTGLLPLWLAWRRFPDRRQQGIETTKAFQSSAWKPAWTS